MLNRADIINIFSAGLFYIYKHKELCFHGNRFKVSKVMLLVISSKATKNRWNYSGGFCS